MITVIKPAVSRVLVIVQAHRHTLESVSACKLCTVSGSKKCFAPKQVTFCQRLARGRTDTGDPHQLAPKP